MIRLMKFELKHSGLHGEYSRSLGAEFIIIF
jgi:hypothetical protein